MLSILIPVYNYDIAHFVKTLHGQCAASGISFEILCFDDASDEQFKLKNRTVSNLKYVTFRELPQNLGRAKIRNELGRAAKYDHLLFLDCDSKVVSNDFIRNYVDNLDGGSLICGGTVYQSEPPAKEFYFRWFYGKHREQIPASERRKNPHHSFMTNNFVVPKNIFLKFLFDENLRQYGHEDTLFGLQLKQAGIPILHIDNPLEHTGLETTDVFLHKTRQAVENLLYLSRKHEMIDTRLLRAYKKIMQLNLEAPLTLVFRIAKKQLVRNFHSTRINLRLFDLYKLGLMLEAGKKKKIDRFELQSDHHPN